MSHNLEFNINEDALKLSIAQWKRKSAIIENGGGKEKLEKIRAQGKLTARDRIAALIDSNTDFLELGLFAGHEMYEEHGGCPAAGVVIGIGVVSGKNCMIVANDASVKAGAWFPITGKKNLRAQEIAMENYLPIIYLVDSAGIYLPMQEEIFADKDHFGRIFRNNAKLSAMGIPQIAAVMGSCVAGGAYLPIMSDETIIVEGTGSIFLAGPYLVKAAIGEEVDSETLGGPKTHTEISGVADYKAKDDQDCIRIIRQLISQQNANTTHAIDKIASTPSLYPSKDIYGYYPENGSKPYDILKILNCIVDQDSLTQFKEEFGKTITCAYARIEGWSVGIVVNNRQVSRSAKGEMQVGGVIYSDSADKAARFIMNCNQKKIPLIFLYDVTGFMVGTRSEHGGIIKDGAKMVMAMANATVPKITVVIGNSYGAGNYAMCGRAYDPRFMFAWPTAKIAVMGGEQAAKVLLQLKLSSIKNKALTTEEKDALLADIKKQYDDSTSVYHAASRMWVDEIIDPAHTRSVIAKCLEVCDKGPIAAYHPGILQV